jgi:hypothetical protein
VILCRIIKEGHKKPSQEKVATELNLEGNKVMRRGSWKRVTRTYSK